MSLKHPIEQLSNLRNNSNCNTMADEVKIKKAADVFKRTLSPMTTTTSVCGVKFDKGVAIAADVGGYYGNMARFTTLSRLFQVNDSIVLGMTGDFADFQYMTDMIAQRSISEDILEDGYKMRPISLYTWLTRLMYSRRSSFDPLWNTVVVAGWDDGAPFLGVIDKLGLAFEDGIIATGMGGYIGVPLLRGELERLGGSSRINKETAHEILTKALEILWYRDTASSSRYRIATVTADGVEITPEKELESQWGIASLVEGY